MSTDRSWERFKRWFFFDSELGFSLDLSRIHLDDDFVKGLEPKLTQAFSEMQALEGGAVANPDEKRMVGHYWLRDPELAPALELTEQINECVKRIKGFASAVHSGSVAPEIGGKFQHILVIGIGGSALGPQFVSHALGSTGDFMDCFFFDNTDPDGMQRVLGEISDLSRTLCLVISKSGGTKETRNGMLIAQNAWRNAGLSFAKAAVAITGEGSELCKLADRENWLARFPMWDWVGGRTSELSAVGLLPAALQGIDIDNLLSGARHMDKLTRRRDLYKNPAALMALAWMAATNGKAERDMVVLPYNDRLELFSRYLQQLVMESLGKELNREGKQVHQGIVVYGNKGSTDQHAYVQQLREGPDNFFAVFIEVLKDHSPKTEAENAPVHAAALEVEPGITSGDYLAGFYQGTREALAEKSKQSISISIREVSEFSVGLLIALFERAVGLYASLVGINAYHQPGVEAGKKAAGEVLALQQRILEFLGRASQPLAAEYIAQAVSERNKCESVFLLLRRLAANSRVKVITGSTPFEDRFAL